MTAPIRPNPAPFLGYWKITSMEAWGQQYVDLVLPGHITFEMEDDNLVGEFQFGTVRGWMDCRVRETLDGPLVEWSWEGHSESDPVSGRGWARVDEDSLTGHLFIHASDDSAFEAAKQKPPKKARRSTHSSPSRLRH